jgi:hypothetical protein
MIHDAKYELKKNTKALTTNEYELLNDHIWAIFSKVQI